jgi:hypothetical protein
MKTAEIKNCQSVEELRSRLHRINELVITSNKPELRLRNEAVRIGVRLVQLGC